MRNNEVIELIGYVYQDPRSPDASQYPNWVVFKVCVNRKFKGKDGLEKGSTNWYECKTNNEGLARIVKDYVKDKCGVYVRGVPQVKAYIDKDGKPQANIEVSVNEVNVLTSPSERSVANNTSSHTDDEIPF